MEHRFPVGVDFYAKPTAKKGRIRQVNSERIKRNTQPDECKNIDGLVRLRPGMRQVTESQSLIWEGCRIYPRTVSAAILGDRPSLYLRIKISQRQEPILHKSYL